MIAKVHFARIAGACLTAALFLFTSCEKVDAGKGPVVHNRIESLDFDKIVLHTGGQLNYRQDNYTQVIVSTTQEVYNSLNIYVEDNTLHIKKKSGVNILNQDEMTFDIVDDDTYSIEVCGSGDIDADFDEDYFFQEHYLYITGSGDITADAVNATEHTSKISGSGSIRVSDLNVTRSYADISGSGNISFLEGYSQMSDVDIHGSGSFRSYDLNTFQSNVYNCGSGSIYLRAEQLLEVELSGSGSVYYKGYPNVVSSVSGSGGVYDMN